MAAKDQGVDHNYSAIGREMSWVEDNLASKGLLDVPDNFEMVAPPYDSRVSVKTREQPPPYKSPQTQAFCKMLDIKLPHLYP